MDMEKFSTSRLIGAPPGYVGYDEGGQLSEAVRRKPYSVVLFDEIEKANPEVFNILLQILDDGRITDNHGHTVDFKNTVLIMTSNLGSDEISEGIEAGGGIDDEVRQKVTRQLRMAFWPEFLNRVDDIILFKTLDRDQIARIVRLLLAEMNRRLEDRRIRVELTPGALETIGKRGFDPVYGARPLKRLLQKEVETRIGYAIISGKVVEGSRVLLDVGAEGGLDIREVEELPAAEGPEEES